MPRIPPDERVCARTSPPSARSGRGGARGSAARRRSRSAPLPSSIGMESAKAGTPAKRASAGSSPNSARSARGSGESARMVVKTLFHRLRIRSDRGQPRVQDTGPAPPASPRRSTMAPRGRRRARARQHDERQRRPAGTPGSSSAASPRRTARRPPGSPATARRGRPAVAQGEQRAAEQQGQEDERGGLRVERVERRHVRHVGRGQQQRAVDHRPRRARRRCARPAGSARGRAR